MTQTPPSFATWMMLLVLGAIWGSSFMGVAVALEGFAPLHVAAIRIFVAAVIIADYTIFTGRSVPGKQKGPRIWGHIIGPAIFSNVLPFSLLGWGMQHVSSGFAGVSMDAVPLFVLPLTHFLVPGDRLSSIKIVGFAIGFAGTVILIGPDAFTRTGENWESVARIACIAAAASYACGAITTRLGVIVKSGV